MRPLRLYIKDFMCYDWAYIDFTQFSSALIVGRTDGDDAEANGVGKTTLFKSIEYVLFNQSSFNLERIVRDDANSCRVVLDFVIRDQEYRLSRTRTRKGSTDLTLYERTAETGPEDQVLHNDIYQIMTDAKYWKDISGRRTTDTEKDLAKLIKINYKSFRTFIHFAQNDFTSLATATPEKRKAILKDALNLVVYSKLEKSAKEKAAVLSRELDRCRALIDNFGDLETELEKLCYQLSVAEEEIASRTTLARELEEKLHYNGDLISQLSNEYSNLESKFSSLVAKEQALVQGKTKTETSIKEYRTKKNNVVHEAKDCLLQLKQLEQSQIELMALNFSEIDILSEKIELGKVLITQNNVSIANATQEYEDLKIPIPTDSMCKHCRQPMNEQHRQQCVAKDRQRMAELQSSVKESKAIITKTNVETQGYQQIINKLIMSKQHLEGVNTKIVSKKKEIVDRRSLHDEYVVLLEKFIGELQEKENELGQVRVELSNSSVEEAKNLQARIVQEKQQGAQLSAQLLLVNKEITHHSSSKAVVIHSIAQKEQDKQKKKDLSKLVKELEGKLFLYPTVIQAFSTVGIPNLIIHNILDSLQLKVNALLNQFKPGLQLSFSIEKTKDDGAEDTLDINYQINGRDRYYEQLSGAQHLMILFSLKLGLYFLLQDELGIDIKFLLLDESDQSLSKGRVDAFAEAIKILQNDFTILVITHNDHLKDKFSHAILVEQERDVSCARVVSSW